MIRVGGGGRGGAWPPGSGVRLVGDRLQPKVETRPHPWHIGVPHGLGGAFERAQDNGLTHCLEIRPGSESSLVIPLTKETGERLTICDQPRFHRTDHQKRVSPSGSGGLCKTVVGTAPCVFALHARQSGLDAAPVVVVNATGFVSVGRLLLNAFVGQLKSRAHLADQQRVTHVRPPIRRCQGCLNTCLRQRRISFPQPLVNSAHRSNGTRNVCCRRPQQCQDLQKIRLPRSIRPHQHIQPTHRQVNPLRPERQQSGNL